MLQAIRMVATLGMSRGVYQASKIINRPTSPHTSPGIQIRGESFLNCSSLDEMNIMGVDDNTHAAVDLHYALIARVEYRDLNSGDVHPKGCSHVY